MKKYTIVWTQRIESKTVEHRDEFTGITLQDALRKWERMNYCNARVYAIIEN